MINPYKILKNKGISNIVCVHRHISLERFSIFIVILNLFHLVHADMKKDFNFCIDEHNKFKHIIK